MRSSRVAVLAHSPHHLRNLASELGGQVSRQNTSLSAPPETQDEMSDRPLATSIFQLSNGGLVTGFATHDSERT
jgi:hypothetical protein